MKNYHAYKNQLVRDLAWTVASPPLIKNNSDSNYTFLSAKYFEEEYNEFIMVLRKLDKNPYELEDHIKNGNTQLLGKYFEALIEFWLEKSETKELLAVNLQVFKNRQTIGEFDFVYKDLLTGNTIHLECAGKFYLAHKQSSRWENFIGPNSVDNLGRKLHKTFNDQINLSIWEEGKDALLIEGIDGKVHPQILLKGYLFYYVDLFFNNNFIMPDDAEESHSKGWWIFAKDIDYFFPGKKCKWIIIERMNWISKIYNPVDDSVYSTNEVIKKLKEYFTCNTYPLLIAELNMNDDGIYEEVSRGFIVSDSWPNLEL